MHAVITADIVNSTLLGPSSSDDLQAMLQQILTPYPHEFFRGDSFQAFIPHAAPSLQVALACRAAARGLDPEAAEVVQDVRLSIGLGPVQEPVTSLGNAKGEAFVLSGRGLDAMGKTPGNLVISTSHELGNAALEVVADHVNSIFGQLTAKQAQVIRLLLCGDTQQQVADRLNRSKSTINQHVTAGRWEEIETLLRRYSRIVQLIAA